MTSGAVFVIGGTVRRGVVTNVEAMRRDCECGRRLATLLVTSPKGRETWICGDCAVQGSEPQPPTVVSRDGERVLCDSVAHVRSTIANGTQLQSGQEAFRLAEEYEAAAKRWVKQTTKHGFKRVKADMRKRRDKSVWMPFASTT